MVWGFFNGVSMREVENVEGDKIYSLVGRRKYRYCRE